MITASDFNNMLSAIVNEYNRRGLSSRTPVPAYNTTPTATVAIFVESAKAVFSDVSYFSGATYSINGENIVATSDLKDTINYIKLLMSQNIRG